MICDEAHRTQYGFKGHVDKKTGEIKYGLAKSMRDALPNATFVAFTGTPISQEDRDTQAVFGEYVDVYDIQQAVEDGATVPIYYESRLAKIKLNESKATLIDEEVGELVEAVAANDKVEQLDALVDILVVTMGAIRAGGFDGEGAWREVMATNFAKIDKDTGKVRKREDGKVLKPEGWKAPELGQFI